MRKKKITFSFALPFTFLISIYLLFSLWLNLKQIARKTTSKQICYKFVINFYKQKIK